MKRIAIYIPTVKQGGAEKQACYLAKVLSRDHEVHFIFHNGFGEASPANLELLQSAPVTLHALTGNCLSKATQLYGICRNNRIDVLFNYLTYCDFVGAIAGKAAGVSRICNGIRNSRLSGWKRVLEKISQRFFADTVIYNCHSGYDFFVGRGFDPKKSVVIPNCIEMTADRPKGNHTAPVRIITVGRFVGQKDYRTALLSIKQLAKIRQDILLTIVGYGEMEARIRNWVSEFGIGAQVNILIKPDNIPELLGSSDIYLSTSLFEGTSNSILEAMNTGLPIVATSIGDNDYLIEEGRNGFLHATGDFTAIAHSLSVLSADPDMRARYGVQSRLILRERYSVEAFTDNYKNLLEEMPL